MEPSSENRRRGRPRAFSDRELSDAEGQATLSRRQLQTKAYARRARSRLSELWLWEELTEGMPVPHCVLAELGRIEDRDTFGQAAAWYRESGRDLSAKNAAAVIRQTRTGKVLREQPAELFGRLIKTIDDYLGSRPGASLRYAERELEITLEHIRCLRMHSPNG